MLSAREYWRILGEGTEGCDGTNGAEVILRLEEGLAGLLQSFGCPCTCCTLSTALLSLGFTH